MIFRTFTLCLAFVSFFLTSCNRTSSDGVIRASGHIEATEVRLAAKVGGRLIEAPLQEGDAVAGGSLVARLETVDTQYMLNQAQADVDAATAQLELLLEGTRREDVERAEEMFARARAEVAAANRDLERLEGLARRGTATEKARDDARTRTEVAERIEAEARANLDKLIAGPRHQEIEVARARRAAAQARVAGIEQQITDASVYAANDGVITERIAEPGEILAPGAVIAVLTHVEHPWLNVWIEEPHLALVRLGQKVTVHVDGVKDDLEGTVTFVSPVAEFTPKNVQTPEERSKLVFKIKIGLENPDGLFKPGMPADAIFKLEDAR